MWSNEFRFTLFQSKGSFRVKREAGEMINHYDYDQNQQHYEAKRLSECTEWPMQHWMEKSRHFRSYWNKVTANVCYNQKVKAANKISDNFFWGQTVATMGPDLLLKAPEAPIPILQYEGQRYKLNFNINFWTTIGVNSTVFPIRIFQFQSKYKSKPFIAGLVPVFKYFIR